MVGKSPSRGYAEAWLVESTTDITKKYTVSKRPDGAFACDCPAWKFAKAPKTDCKHIRLVKLSLNSNCELERLPTPPTQPPPREINLRPARANIVNVKFDGETVAWITQEQAERLRENLCQITQPAEEAKPAASVSYGDFTIRRKFKFGAEN